MTSLLNARTLGPIEVTPVVFVDDHHRWLIFNRITQFLALRTTTAEANSLALQLFYYKNPPLDLYPEDYR